MNIRRESPDPAQNRRAFRVHCRVVPEAVATRQRDCDSGSVIRPTLTFVIWKEVASARPPARVRDGSKRVR